MQLILVVAVVVLCCRTTVRKNLAVRCTMTGVCLSCVLCDDETLLFASDFCFVFFLHRSDGVMRTNRERESML